MISSAPLKRPALNLVKVATSVPRIKVMDALVPFGRPLDRDWRDIKGAHYRLSQVVDAVLHMGSMEVRGMFRRVIVWV